MTRGFKVKEKRVGGRPVRCHREQSGGGEGKGWAVGP